MFIKEFKDITRFDVALVGGKGASLGEMTLSGILVPPGFVVTTETFKTYNNQEIPIDVQEKILKAFDKLRSERVAVRSSAVAEDSLTASWAGQLESYLNVPREDLIKSIRNCWNSIRSERALSYAAEQNLSEEKLSVAVIVQKMIESEVSGVMFTVNPITKNPNEIMIEAGFGLGELLVQGLITPSNFVIDKKTFRIISRDIQIQDKMLIFKDGKNQGIRLSKKEGSKQALTDKQLRELARIGTNIEKHYDFPQDIEWAMEKDKFHILQSRPITTL